MKPSQVLLLVGAALSLGAFALVTPSIARAQGSGFAGSTQESVFGNQTITLSIQNGDVREALRQLFRKAGLQYSIAPEVQGTVTINVENAPVQSALRSLLAQVDGDYVVDVGVVNVIRKRDRRIVVGGGPEIQNFTIRPDSIPEPTPNPVVESDAEYLYLISGRTVAKVRKKDLEVMKVVTVPSVVFAPNAKSKR